MEWYKSIHDGSGGVADEGRNDFYRNGDVDDDDRDDDDYEVDDDVPCATDETKLRLSLSAKQCQNPCSEPYLCARIWVRAMIGLLKKPLWIC